MDSPSRHAAEPHRQLSLKQRLFLSATIATISIIMICAVGLIGMQHITTTTSSAMRADLKDSDVITRLRSAIADLDRDFRQALIETDATWIAKAHALEYADRDEITATQKAYDALP